MSDIPDALFVSSLLSKITALESALTNQNEVIDRLSRDIDELSRGREKTDALVDDAKHRLLRHQKK